MSWSEVNTEMEKIEQIVQEIDSEESKSEEPKEHDQENYEGIESQPSSEPSSLPTRALTEKSSPPSYRRFSSPRPPKLHLPVERKLSAGILRYDSSGSSRNRPEPTSPAPSADRLSVTFCDETEEAQQMEETAESREDLVSEPDTDQAPDTLQVESSKLEDQGEENAFQIEAEEMFGPEVGAIICQTGEEYTDSLLEIQRLKSRGNTQDGILGGRRKSSGTIASLGVRRKSSVSSSILARQRRSQVSSDAESLISTSRSRSRSSAVSRGDVDAVKLHNEVIEMTKYQIWPLEKKMRIVGQAKEYVKKHQSEMEERLAQSRTCSSRLKQVYWMLVKFMQMIWKLIRDFMSEITPWQQKIKEIESHFGSVVSSYFVFLRWIFWMNVVITILLAVFVIVPEVLAADWNGTGARKKMLPVEQHYAYNLKVMFDFEGILRYSPIFYGYYSEKTQTKAGYNIPLAYFCSMMAVYVFSFAIILKKMAQNNEQSKLSEKGDECTFTWKVFASWDYGIANVETAHNKVASITMGFREALVEEMEKEREHEKDWKVIAKRALANFLVVILLGLSAYAVIFVVERSTRPDADSTWYRQNEITIVMSFISWAVPNCFDVVSMLENYHPRKAMRWMLGRIMMLNLLSLYTLIFALFGKTDGMIDSLKKMEEMKNAGINFGLDVVTPKYEEPKDCFMVPIPCYVIERVNFPPILNLEFNQEEAYEFVSPTQATNATLLIVTSKQNDSTPQKNCSECIETCGLDCQISCSEKFECVLDNNFNNQSIFNATCSSCVENYLDETFEDSTEIPEVNILIRGDMEYNEFSTMATNEEVGIMTLDEEQCERKICRRRFFGTKKPPEIKPMVENCIDAKARYIHELKEKLQLRKLCWETMFGQELVKLTVMDTLFTVVLIIIGDFGRSLFLRVLNPCWFWDLELQMPKYPDFKVAENILHLVNNQGMIWMGLFMAPGLPAINLIKLIIIMYTRAWAVMTTNVPHETVFRASRSNNFYFVLLLVMLFLCTLPVAYAIVWLKPSWHCGPFATHDKMYKVFTEVVLHILPQRLHAALDYITSPGIVIPTLVLLVLIIYYLISLTGLLRESNEDLKNQLHHERTEERRKLVKGKQDSGESTANIHEKWKKILGSALSSQQDPKDQRFETKSIDVEAATAVVVAVPEAGNEKINEASIKEGIVDGCLTEKEGKTSKKKFLSAIWTSGTSKKKANVQRPGSELSFQSVNEISSIAEPVTPDGEQGSLCNRFHIEGSGATTTSAVVEGDDKSKVQASDEAAAAASELHAHPPKIWISKSASMDDDLEQGEDD